MKSYKDHLNQFSIFEIVRSATEKLGLESYVIGGYVRNLILEKESKDLDFVCVGNGMQLAKEVAKGLGKESKLSVYKTYGTASIHHGGFVYEFVGARKESYHPDSRNPEVVTGTFEDDLIRRDFTINTLAISLNTSTYGDLVDTFHGVEDINKRIIKTPTDPVRTFSDDPLRMMRAIRFATQLTFDIEADTFDAIVSQCERIKIITQERISDELNKIIMSKTPSYGFKLLFHAGLLTFIFPEMVKLQGVQKKNGKGHKDNFYHTLQVLDNISEMTDNLWLRWAAILHDIAKPATQRFHEKAGWTFHGHEDLGAKWVPGIFKRMRLPQDERMKYVQKLVRLHLRPIALVSSKVTDSAVRRMIFEAGSDVDDLMTLCKADITSKNPERVQRYKKNFDLVSEKIREVEERDRIMNFQPPISGETILETFDIKPGKIIGDIKTAIKEAILDGKIANDESEAFDMMIRLGEKYELTRKK